ncbi:MAG TPA: DNA polymerase IV [Thermoplasmata archaeon]|nr:DNA polymerase IV [Thermoplasmata archaeon]
MRWIIYIDLDAYYVSCERRDRPELEGRPVIVGPDPHHGPSRGVVLSASYEARRNGVHSAMPVGRAAQLCPEATWVAPDFEKYAHVASEVRTYLTGKFGRVVPLSIDEAALSVELADETAARSLAEAIQSGITETLRLPCSIGVAASRIVAKIATDEAKPGGIRVVPPERTAEFLAPLSVRAIPGVGPKTEETLAAVGAKRIGELRSLPPAVRRKLGSYGEELYRLARGDIPIEAEESDAAPRSRSSEHTFDRDLDDPRELAATVERLSEDLSSSLVREHLRYRTATVAIRWEDFQRSQRSRTLPSTQEGPEALRAASGRLFAELWRTEQKVRRRRVRTVSVGVEKLAEAIDRQARLDQFGPSNPPQVK